MATINKQMKTFNVPNGNDTVCYEIVDASVRDNLVKVSETQPADDVNKLWIHDGEVEEYTIPTIDEFNNLSSATNNTRATADETEYNLGETEKAIGVGTSHQTKNIDVWGPFTYTQTGRLAVAVPYMVNGVVKKIKHKAGIGNVANNTGTLYCALVDPYNMKNCSGKNADEIPYIAIKSTTVTAGTATTPSSYSDIEFDFSQDNIPFYGLLYVLIYVVPTSSDAPIYIRNCNYYTSHDHFPLDFVVSASYPVYAVLNSSGFVSVDYTKAYYSNVEFTIEKTVKTFSPLNNNYWAGKVAVAYGSSLTANGGWTDVLKERFGFAKMYNRGSGGTTLTNLSGLGLSNYVTSITVYNDSEVWDEARNTCYYDANDVPTGYESYAHTNTVTGWQSGTNRINTLPTDADLVIIDLATNDWFRIQQNNLGWENYLNDPVFYTAYNQGTHPYSYDITILGDAYVTMIQQIQTRCPKAKIVVWGMLYNNTICNKVYSTQSASTDLETWNNLYDYLAELSKTLGVCYVDMREESGINVFNLTSYCEDGIHPYKPTYTTEKGKYAVANVLTKHINALYPKDFGV